MENTSITVEGKTNVIGSVIGGGKTTLRTGELEYSDIHDIGEMDGKDMRSIFERWKDKRTQEKRYGGK